MFFTETTTSEGLAINELPADEGSTIVCEVGHFGYVIYKYRIRPVHADRASSAYTIQDDVSFLVQRVADLERRCAAVSEGQVVKIELAQWRWNFKAAKRRLRRWITERDAQLLEIPSDRKLWVPIANG